MTHTFGKYLIALILVFSFSRIRAQQTCSGALGDPVINIDFGRGASNIGQRIAETNYFYVAGNPSDGQYTVVQTSAGLNGGWHQNIVNHTPNDPTGYMMLVNADYNKGIFYQNTINNLCPNTTYEFAAWIINILRGSGIKPNIKFTIENNGLSIKEFSTGDIPEGSATDWIKYRAIFTTPANVGVITLKMTNENPGGSGNDLAIDDITFRACGPNITSIVTNANNFNNNIANICIGDTKTLIISSQVSPGTYNSPQYQWQEFDGTNWINSMKQGAQTADLKVDFFNASLGSYAFQVLVSENGNINSSYCRVVSTPITISVNDKPSPVTSNNGPVCMGSSIQLNAAGGSSYSWTGPNFTSTEQNPRIDNATAANAGFYEVTVTNAGGCTNTSKTKVEVLPALITSISPSASICKNESINLQASGGIIYTWLPITGLSDPNIANPIASPEKTTTYSVSIFDGQCTIKRYVTITLLKNTVANAGNDKKLLTGQAVTLNGNATGDYTSFLWSPIDYLDDPTKLNPIATPPNDMTYTLTVNSNCDNSTDQVFVKVYQKIEIPNTFSPNGDGINDTWSIPSISAFEKPILRVVNRNGQLVYESSNNQAWDGKYNGKNLPAGVYYYSLYLNEHFKLYSGWVMLTR